MTHTLLIHCMRHVLQVASIVVGTVLVLVVNLMSRRTRTDKSDSNDLVYGQKLLPTST
jgi:hypothetical protein